MSGGRPWCWGQLRRGEIREERKREAQDGTGRRRLPTRRTFSAQAWGCKTRRRVKWRASGQDGGVKSAPAKRGCNLMRAGLALRQAKQMGRRRRSNRASGPLSWAAVGWDGGGGRHVWECHRRPEEEGDMAVSHRTRGKGANHDGMIPPPGTPQGSRAGDGPKALRPLKSDRPGRGAIPEGFRLSPAAVIRRGRRGGGTPQETRKCAGAPGDASHIANGHQEQACGRDAVSGARR